MPKAMIVALLSVLTCDAAFAEWPGYETNTTYTPLHYTVPAPVDVNLTVTHKTDPWDQLFLAMMAHGQRKHEERMLRLMLDRTPPPTAPVAVPPRASRSQPAARSTSRSSSFTDRWMECMDQADQSGMEAIAYDRHMDRCMGSLRKDR